MLALVGRLRTCGSFAFPLYRLWLCQYIHSTNVTCYPPNCLASSWHCRRSLHSLLLIPLLQPLQFIHLTSSFLSCAHCIQFHLIPFIHSFHSCHTPSPHSFHFFSLHFIPYDRIQVRSQHSIHSIPFIPFIHSFHSCHTPSPHSFHYYHFISFHSIVLRSHMWLCIDVFIQ